MKREKVESTHSARLLLVFFPAIIAFIWIFYQGDRLSIASTSETIIFQGGIGIEVTAFGILLIAGLFSYVWRSKAWRDIRNADKWYKDGASLQILVLLFVGIVAIGLGAYYYPYSEKIVIDTSQQILSKENNYIMRSGGHEFQISFNEIDHVRFYIRGGVGEVIDTKNGFVAP